MPKPIIVILFPIVLALASRAEDWPQWRRSEEHTSELQSPCNLVCRLLLEKKKIHKLSATKAVPLHKLLLPSSSPSGVVHRSAMHLRPVRLRLPGELADRQPPP